FKKINKFSSPLKNYVSAGIATVFIGYNLFALYLSIHHHQWGFYESAEKVTQTLIARNAEDIHFNSVEYSLCTRLDYELAEKPVKITVQQFLPKYQTDFVVLEKNQHLPDTTSYKNIYEDKLVTVWQKKGL
ncbi:MAG: hypothetical protein H7Y04_00650, partial [Verrucomicrobia bacterium]|nr:hypothetical protein [Cytophagales bacterium]